MTVDVSSRTPGRQSILCYVRGLECPDVGQQVHRQHKQARGLLTALASRWHQLNGPAITLPSKRGEGSG